LSSASLKIIEENLDKMPPENKGTGLQRALLVNLIKFWAATDKKYKKLTQNEPPTILLFEEPEVFQHPQKQSIVGGSFWVNFLYFLSVAAQNFIKFTNRALCSPVPLFSGGILSKFSSIIFNEAEDNTYSVLIGSISIFISQP
jgi:hypothetical protein